MIIKKRSTALAFHGTREAIAAGEVEIQHIPGHKNCSDFLAKTVNNVKFIACTKALIVPCSRSIN